MQRIHLKLLSGWQYNLTPKLHVIIYFPPENGHYPAGPGSPRRESGSKGAGSRQEGAHAGRLHNQGVYEGEEENKPGLYQGESVLLKTTLTRILSSVAELLRPWYQGFVDDPVSWRGSRILCYTDDLMFG